MKTQKSQLYGAYCNHVGNNENNIVLKIRRCESTFLSYLVVALVLKVPRNDMFVKDFVLNKAHRDDGMNVIKTKWKIDDFFKID